MSVTVATKPAMPVRARHLTVVALLALALVGGLTTTAPAVDAKPRVRCEVVSAGEWYLVYGEKTEYGGTVCWRV